MSTTDLTFANTSFEPPLSARDLEEIEEYERIVKFAENILGGRNPRVRVEPRTRSIGVQVDFSITAPKVKIESPASTVKVGIDFHADYYKALGVGPNVSVTGLENAYRTKLEVFHPSSAQGISMRQISVKHAANAESRYLLAKNAYAVLSVPNLRAQYDAGRK